MKLNVASTHDKLHIKAVLTTPAHPNIFIFHDGMAIYLCNWRTRDFLLLRTRRLVRKMMLMGSYVIYTSETTTAKKINVGTIPELLKDFKTYDGLPGTNFVVLPSGKLVIAGEKSMYLYDFKTCTELYTGTERIKDITLFDKSHLVIFVANSFFHLNRIFNYETLSFVSSLLQSKQLVTVLPKRGLLRLERVTNKQQWSDKLIGRLYWIEDENIIKSSVDIHKRTIQLFYNYRIDLYSMGSIEDFQQNLIQKVYKRQGTDIKFRFS